ncbi:MAG: acylphosphatase [Casimicrobiaceae bacterium]
MSASTSQLVLRLLIFGRVQGVGFRAALQAEAARLGVHGWVRNRTDGSVETVIAGAPRAVRALVRWAERGPLLARVERVLAASADAEALSDGPAQGVCILPDAPAQPSEGR